MPESAGATSAIEKSWLEMKEKLQAIECYHGFLPRKDAELLLQEDGDYLLRIIEERLRYICQLQCRLQCLYLIDYSIDPPAGSAMPTKRAIVLSMYGINSDMKTVKNVLIRKINKKYLVESTQAFDSVAELIDNYTREVGTVNLIRVILRNPINRQDLEFRTEKVEAGRIIGEGSSSLIFAGKVQLKNGQVIECALKKATGNVDIRTLKIDALMQEARLLRQIPEHKNIMQIYGFAVDESPLYQVIELTKGGDLKSYLQKNGPNMPKHEKLKMCLDAALGVEFLHRNQCIHRDLAARNCLYTHDKVVKISDFQLAHLGEQFTLTVARKMPIRWLAPEILRNFTFTFKTDVYSYGVVVYEVWADGAQPFDGHSVLQVKEMLLSGQMLTMDAHCPEELRTLVQEKVFVMEPDKRASMTDVVGYLENLLMQDLTPLERSSPAVTEVVRFPCRMNRLRALSAYRNVWI